MIEVLKQNILVCNNSLNLLLKRSLVKELTHLKTNLCIFI